MLLATGPGIRIRTKGFVLTDSAAAMWLAWTDAQRTGHAEQLFRQS
jgi:hypothetical protein